MNPPPDAVDPQEIWAETVSEAAFQQHVITEATMQGWFVYHHDTVPPKCDRCGHRVKRAGRILTARGWPDLVLIRDDVTMYVELKSHKGLLTQDQKHVRNILLNAGHDYFVWRPQNWDTVCYILMHGPGSQIEEGARG